LVLALGAAILLNLLLLATFVWVELLAPGHLRLGWLAAGTLWGGSAILSVGYARRGGRPRVADSAEGLFRGALSEYLQGSWFEAETILVRLLNENPRDAEARLLLATLLRHTRRYGEALAQLARLELLRDAEAWAQEIAAEKRAIALRQATLPAASPIAENEKPAETAYGVSERAA
jgi:hypothetical protein